jgi:hypothetical protein
MRFVAVLLLVAGSSFGAITYVSSPGPDANNSVQSATRILVFGDTPNESGCVGFNGTTDVFNCVDSTGLYSGTYTGANTVFSSQSLTRTIASLNIADGSDLRIVFDATEPAGDEITISALTFLVFNSAGTVIFHDSLAAPQVFSSTLTGNGQTDAVFKLDAAGQAAYDLAVIGYDLSTLRVGIYSNAILAASGNEAFYVGDFETFPDGVPEPGTYVMVGTGLAGLLLRRRLQK